MTLTQWAERWGLPPQALVELAGVPAVTPVPFDEVVTTESGVQARVRLEAARLGKYLWRNNVGVLMDKNGRPVRYGLGNDSANVNAVIKSGDLIGLERVLIKPEHVGTIIGRFVSRECKRPGWKFDPSDARDCAQLRWCQLINSNGGNAAIVNSEGSL